MNARAAPRCGPANLLRGLAVVSLAVLLVSCTSILGLVPPTPEASAPERPLVDAHAGPGWRLISWGEPTGPERRGTIAVNEAQAEAAVGPVAGGVDFATEVVAVFHVDNVSTGCRPPLLDRVTIDHAARTVVAGYADPGDPPGPCPAIIVFKQFVVAIRRDALPVGPFRLWDDANSKWVVVDL